MKSAHAVVGYVVQLVFKSGSNPLPLLNGDVSRWSVNCCSADTSDGRKLQSPLKSPHTRDVHGLHALDPNDRRVVANLCV